MNLLIKFWYGIKKRSSRMLYFKKHKVFEEEMLENSFRDTVTFRT